MFYYFIFSFSFILERFMLDKVGGRQESMACNLCENTNCSLLFFFFLGGDEETEIPSREGLHHGRQ